MNQSMVFGKKGFSLIEVLICLVFLSIGLLAIASLQVTSVRGNFFSNNLMQATYVAQDGLEILRARPLPPYSFDSDPLLSVGNHSISGTVFNRSYIIANDANGYKKITYAVTWNDGVDHHITFSTIKSP
jgi:prepilin-type N-terminal cleavage/methylation domain-containing protein